MYVGLIAGRSAVPDLPLLIRYLDEALEQLAVAAGTRKPLRKSA
jgi:hypothetical protein